MTLLNFINNFVVVFTDFQIKDFNDKNDKCLSCVSYITVCDPEFKNDIEKYSNYNVVRVDSEISNGSDHYIMIYIKR